MAPPENARRFRINPVEMGIFSVMAIVFLASLYNLFYNPSEFRPAALVSMNSNPISEGRAPASVFQPLLTTDVPCGQALEISTSSNRVRLNGSLCGAEPGDDGVKIAKTSIINQSNQFKGTFFADSNTGKFTTDYIPLNPGRNPIHVEYSYDDGKTISQDVVVNKN